MADCKIVNEKVANTVSTIQKLATEYAQAGTDFETAFMSAISEMEGDSKDAMVDLFNKSYKDFVTSMESGLPAMINGLASLLEVIVTILKRLMIRLHRVSEMADSRADSV